MENQSFSNNTNGWNSTNQVQNNILFSICILATILHFNVWLQLFIQKVEFNLSFIFSLCYTLADVFLLLCYFIEYSIRVRSRISVTIVSCYFETYAMLFFNLYESYCLTALNIARYCQIVHNQNIYITHRRVIFLVFILIPLWILSNFILQELFGWCHVTNQINYSCYPTYTNLAIQIWNLLLVLILPIVISFSMLYRSLDYLKNSFAQQVTLRRNHHRKLIIHTSIFYSIWLFLWFPFIVITFSNIKHIDEWIVFTASLGNIIQICSDSIIVYFLDKRFAQAFKKCRRWIQHIQHRFINIRVHAIA